MLFLSQYAPIHSQWGKKIIIYKNHTIFRSLKLDNGSKCGFSGSGQYTLFQIMYYVTYKLSAIFENLLAVVILCVKLLQEPLAFLCKK